MHHRIASRSIHLFSFVSNIFRGVHLAIWPRQLVPHWNLTHARFPHDSGKRQWIPWRRWIHFKSLRRRFELVWDSLCDDLAWNEWTTLFAEIMFPAAPPTGSASGCSRAGLRRRTVEKSTEQAGFTGFHQFWFLCFNLISSPLASERREKVGNLDQLLITRVSVP